MQVIEKTIDSQGRIIIPREMRDELNIKPGDKFKLRNTKTGIELYPVDTFCVICGKQTKHRRNNIFICPECVAKLNN